MREGMLGLAGRRPVAGVTSEAQDPETQTPQIRAVLVFPDHGLHSTAQRAVPPVLSVIFRPSIRRFFDSSTLAVSPCSSIGDAAGGDERTRSVRE